MSNSRNCLSYWFPKLEAAGIPVPETRIVRIGSGHGQVGNIHDMLGLLDGVTPDWFPAFCDQLRAAAREVGGFPAFLRTGLGSGKHQWEETCHVANGEAIAAHVGALVEWSEMVDFMGLPVDVWVLRELLPVDPVAVLPRYGNMPLVREMRGFVRGGETICLHDYWPPGAIRQGYGKELPDPETVAALVAESAFPAERIPEVRELLSRVSQVFKDAGAWSVDILYTRRGLYVTDMAEAARSFHWEGCQHAESFK